EDVKVASDVSVGSIRKEADENGWVEWKRQKELYLGILQWWDKGSAFGIPYDIWVKMGGDYDGDIGILNVITHLPMLTKAVRALGDQESHKMPKTTTGWYERYQMLVYAMVNGVGFATNLTSNILANGPTYAEQVLLPLLPRNALSSDPVVKGHLDGTIAGLWKEANRHIKMMTDGFKRMINTPKLMAYLFTLQSVIAGHFGGSAPWTHWGQDRNSYAFRRGLPEFEWQIAQDDPDFYELCTTSSWNTGPQWRSDWRWRSRIPPTMENGTPAQIYKIVQPALADWLLYYSENGVTPLIMDITCTPLSEFANWAVRVEVEDIEKAEELYKLYLSAQSNVNWADADDDMSSVATFKTGWRDACSKWAAQFPTTDYAAAVLWHRTHMSGSDASRASAVFNGFPEEARKIVINKPGLKEKGKQYMTRLVGLEYNFTTPPFELNGVPVEVVVAEIKQQRRTVIVAMKYIEGLKETSLNYPEFTIGVVSKLGARDLRDGFNVPPAGTYSMDLQKSSRGRAWTAWLSPMGS
ncbi:MAG: hypothetical protein ACWGQW_08735, partial [bacterium]